MDESYPAAKAQGYLNIAFGSASYTRITKPDAPPEKDAAGVLKPSVSVLLATRKTPWFFYLETDFSVAPASSYTSSLIFELISK